jgi:hypothetical protein
MATNIDISVKGLGELDKATKEIDKGAKSMNALKTELRQLTQQLQSMDAGSEEFLKLSQKAGDVRDKIKDTSEAINANAGPAFERLGNNASLLTSKLASLDFGGASESVGALAQSVKGVSFKTLGAELGTFTKSLGTLGKALLTNPIFLLATAILAIIMNFETLKNTIPGVNEALTGVTDEMTDALDASKAMTEQSKQQLQLISESENVLKLQGKSERDILNMKIKASEQTLLDLKSQMQVQKNISDAQIKTAARNKEIASGIIQFLTIPLQGILATIDLIGQAVGQNFGLRDKFNEFTSNLLFDPDEAKKKAAEEEKALQDQYRQLENQRAGFILSVQAMDKQAAEKGAAARAEKEKAEANERAKRLSEEANILRSLVALEEQALSDKLKAEYEANQKRIALMDERFALEQELTLSEQEKEIASVVAQYEKKYELAAGNAELERQLAEKQGEEIDAINAKYAQEEMVRQQQLNASKFQMASDVLNGISSLNDLFNSGSEKNAKRAFQINKGIQIAQAIAETYKGANAIFAAAALNPASILFPAQPFIAAGAAVAAGLANVKRISATKFEGGGGGASGGGGGAAPSFAGGGGGGTTPQFSALNTTFLQGQQNQTPPVQAYVLAGNVESQMQAREKIQDQSTL